MRLAIAGLALASLCACQSAETTSQAEGPPLYVIERGDARVYLLGIAVPPDRSWLTPEIEAAFNEADELWQENPTGPPNPDQQLVAQLGLRESGSLFDALGTEEHDRVLRAAEVSGLTREQLAPMKPWFAAFALSFARDMQAVSSGAPAENPMMVLQAKAQERGIPIRSELEDYDAFTRLLAAMPDETQHEYLLYQLDFLEEGESGSADDAEWALGNTDSFEQKLDAMRETYPSLYRYLNVERNAEWVDRIENMLASGGVHFIDLGLNHTLGPDSIQVQAKQRGLSVRRL
jgi:uncharacterized protein YbaP (TraB family)